MPYHAELPLWVDRTPEEKITRLQALVEDLYHYTLGAVNERLLASLALAEAADDDEAESIRQMRALIAEHPNIIAQNCEVGHITGSALIIDTTQGRLLLHLHKRLNLWLPMGGHADYETDFSQVALREAYEETGLPDLRLYPNAGATRPVDYDVHTIPRSSDRPQHLHLDFRYLLATSQPDAIAPLDDEATDFRWLSFDEAIAEEGLREDLKRLFRKAARVHQAGV